VLIFTKTSLALVNSLLLKLSWTRLGAYLTSDYHPQPVSFIRTILSKPDKSIAMDASQDHCLSTDRDQYNYSVVESVGSATIPEELDEKGHTVSQPGQIPERDEFLEAVLRAASEPLARGDLTQMEKHRPHKPLGMVPRFSGLLPAWIAFNGVNTIPSYPWFESENLLDELVNIAAGVTWAKTAFSEVGYKDDLDASIDSRLEGDESSMEGAAEGRRDNVSDLVHGVKPL